MLNILCALLEATDITYDKIADNEISVPAVSLRALKENANSIRTDHQLDEAEYAWIDDEVYIHISEKDKGFSIAVMSN